MNFGRSHVLVEQAIFGSGTTSETAGYRILAASPGIDESDRRALLRLCPSHDGIVPGAAQAIAGQPLSEGRYLLMAVRTGGREFSGRGLRTTTRAFIVPREALLRFAGRPDAVLNALAGKGALSFAEHVPATLAPLHLVGRATDHADDARERLVARWGRSRLDEVHAALGTERCAILVGETQPEATLADLWQTLPLGQRCELGFSSALHYVAQRGTHVICMPAKEQGVEHLGKRFGATVFDAPQ